MTVEVGCMHCVKVRVDGFKRLSQAACNTDTHLLAFVGPNEAGKSSLLQGLVWLTDPDAEALEPKDLTRGRELVDSHVVVQATYELSTADKAVVADLQVVERPSRFLLERCVDGSQRSDGLPTPRRDPKPFQDAQRKMEKATRTLAKQIEAAEQAVTEEELDEDEISELPRPREWLGTVSEAVGNPEVRGWPDEVGAAADSLVEWLEEVPPTSRVGKARDAELAKSIRNAKGIVSAEHPRDTARNRLLARVPRFLQFSEEHRELQRVHVISEEDDRRNPAPALTNLLQIAKLDLGKLWKHIEDGDGSSTETDIETANDNLGAFFGQAWNQSKVAVRLKLDSKRLELWLKELDGAGGITDIEERSDGLLMFISLAAFVASQHLTIPPILLIDEAETHLHFDAQADLVGVLLKQVDVTQIFYTTHSPGCLPTDLGVGIRLVQRSKTENGISRIHSDFWTNQAPGFAPLLYAMGASAAAFSACRMAVLAEGAADMVLLPTLIRKANNLDDLPYQIAPGLANAHAFGMDVEEVAAKVVYLTDGDDEGATYRKQLKEAGVPDSRVFSLPKDMASEDLVNRPVFIRIVNTLLPDGVEVTADDLPPGRPIAKALEEWTEKEGHSLGHVAIAYGLINNRRELVLAPRVEAALRRLHQKFLTAFGATNP